MLFSPNDVIHNVRILEYVGAGAFGEVYHAIDTVMNRECAVKYVENKDPTAFKAHIEAQVLHKCRHDRVVDVYDVVPIAHNGRKYAAIEMEYLPDGSCETYLEKNHISLRRSIRWLIDILFALENSHNNQVLHRDVKPANFMLKGSQAKLSDFGLAKITGGVPHGSANGTPVYAAPELFTSSGKTSIASEVFSAGMSFFQLVTNLRDWAATPVDMSVIRKGSVIKKVGYPRYVPDRVRRICNRACNLDPGKRYKSAREMRQALEGVTVKLDWMQVGINNWKANVGEDLHQLTIEPGKARFELVYQVNSRRKNKRCSNHAAMADAVNALHDEIYQSSIK